MLRSLLLLAAVCSRQPVSAQVQDSTWIRPEFPSSSTYFGFDAGADLSGSPQFRMGYSLAGQFAGCAGWGAVGHAAGISFRPKNSAYGAYAHAWITMLMVNFGLRAGYETDARSRWATFQPEIGLGVGLLRVTYNYCLPVWFGERRDVPRHNLGIAYTFPLAEIE